MAAYILMALGVYLISDIDFLVKQGQDLQNYQEIVLSDIYHPTTIFDPDAQQHYHLSRADLEQSISKHQLVILDHSRYLGLKRGYSDPSLHCSTSMVNLSEGFDDQKTHDSDDDQADIAASNDRSTSCPVLASVGAPRNSYGLSKLRPTMSRLFGVSGNTSLSSVPNNPLSVTECKVHETERTKKSHHSHEEGCWDCEAGDATESTDRYSYGSSHISSSDGFIYHNDDWVYEDTERYEEDKIYDA
jgi:hypothetical protein